MHHFKWLRCRCNEISVVTDTPRLAAQDPLFQTTSTILHVLDVGYRFWLAGALSSDISLTFAPGTPDFQVVFN